MYMRHNDVYILAVTKSNANVMLTFQFMTQVWPSCAAYSTKLFLTFWERFAHFLQIT